MSTSTAPRQAFVGVLLIAACLLAPGPARAQVTSLGVSPTAPAFNLGVGVLSWVAYDDKHDVYLHVYEASGTATAHFIAADGSSLGDPFPIRAAGYQPKVAYSHHDSGVDIFFVTYIAGNDTFGQLVAYTGAGASGGGLVGAFFDISTDGTVEVPNDVVYNPLTQQFLVTYQQNFNDVFVRPFWSNGTAASPPINVTGGTGTQGAARLALDWEQNRYLVVYSGDNPDGGSTGIFARLLDGADGQPVSGTIVVSVGGLLEPTVSFLPERDGFMLAWTSFDPDRNVSGRFVPTGYSGTLPDPQFFVLALPGTGEGAPSLDYDPYSRRVLVAAMTEPKNIGGVLLDGNGGILTSPFNLASVSSSAAGSGAFFPTTRAAEDARVGVAYIIDYEHAYVERFQLPVASPPGPMCCSGGPPPPPPPPTETVVVHVDAPSASQTLSPPFLVRGWAVDLRSASGPGVPFVQVFAFSTTTSDAYYLGWATVGAEARTDVQAMYGSNFLNSGFNLSMANVPPGSYQLALFPYSGVTSSFENDKAAYVDVTVTSGATTRIDQPTWAQTYGSNGIGMTVSGYAVDSTKPTGTGVDQVLVFAVNAVNGAGSFLGYASLGINRPDVAAAYGDARFAPSGYSLTNSVSLAPGVYYILVASHSTGASGFNPFMLSAVVIQ